MAAWQDKSTLEPLWQMRILVDRFIYQVFRYAQGNTPYLIRT